MKELIERILNHKSKYEDNSFEPWEIGASNKELFELVRLGILEITLKTNRTTLYRLKDREKAIRLLEIYNVKIDKSKPLFDSIIGYDEHKEIIKRVLESDKPMHLLLLGRPGTAKTLFLLELTKIPNAIYVTPYISYSGLFNYLNYEPPLILIDQIDNLKYNDVYRLLIDLCEYGIITKTTANEVIAKVIKSKVIATANTTKRIPEALLSRFLVLQFKTYTDDEFIKISKQLLQSYDLPEDVKSYIIEKCLNKKDIRNVLKLANICRNRDDVDKFMKIIRFL